MAVRTFDGESWICGWHNEEGRLIDTQQYTSEDMARNTARKMAAAGYFPFVGKLETV